ncbi:hypothetical protein EDD15DRAFT_2476512 [Pisolithus albus]|nr:hypothetical protein EDD15DRAFT_2476512 [Pisolithus albus]
MIAGRGLSCLRRSISDSEDHLADSIWRELRKLKPEGRQGVRALFEIDIILTKRNSSFDLEISHTRTRGDFVSADADQVSHIALAGDVSGGKAWRTVRRPSDMNEYAERIGELCSWEKPVKAHGKVFVRVLGIKGLNVPIPQQPTAVTCMLNNGIHFVTTPETRLSRDTHTDQEFELYARLELLRIILLQFFHKLIVFPPQTGKSTLGLAENFFRKIGILGTV